MWKNNEMNCTYHKPWKKALCVLLSVIIAFGALISLTASTEKFRNFVEMRSLLSDYALGIVSTKGAIAVDNEAMLSDNTQINLKNRDGSNTVYLFSEPVSYIDKDGKFQTKDISVEKQTDKALKAKGYEYTNGQNDYRVNFSKDSSKGLYIEFAGGSYSIIPQSSNAVNGNKNVSEFLSEQFEDFEYQNIYGDGTNLKFYPQLNGIKDEIVLNSNIGQNVFSFKLVTDNCTAVLNDDGTISLVNNENKEAVQTFSAPFAYDSAYVDGEFDEHYIDCEYTLEKQDDNTYIMSVNVDKAWLESDSTVYPITIDPTTANLSYTYDVSIYSAKASNNYGAEQLCCFGRATAYGYGRVLYYFKMPADIKKGATINSAYSWVRETTGRTASTNVTPYIITNSWSETSATYSNKPNYTTAVSMASRNINSTSTDNPNSKFWYKFNIAPAVKAWADGTYTNRGLMFISSEETNGGYNWRAFASRENSTSSYRPYYVINYTNDTTAPTVTSVTGNPTAWTKNNVTLTVNGAKDNTGGAGLHATPYSFSTTKGSYAWQAGNTKTFSANSTVYVYVRDAIGNIRLVSTQTINKIDKTKPSKPTVTGNPTDWTTEPITLTANSTDSASGIKDYSFSTVKGSYSWQTGKTKSFTENTTVYVYARDNAGNISDATEVVISKHTVDPVYLIDPVFYEENNLVGIYNPRIGKENMQYKIGDSGEWTDYTAPFAIPLGETVTVYAKFASSQNAVISQTFTKDAKQIGAYTESNTDFSLAYKNVSFDFTRAYNSIDKKWFFATDSKVTAVNDYVISVVLPDSAKLSFVKTADNTYKNEINGCTLIKSDNGYVIQLDGINYTYGADGKLSKISNKYDDTITVTRNASSITITDGANRVYTLALNSSGNIISVTDPANNVIAYTYDSNNNLTKVIDQAGVTLGQYSYTNGVLTKSGDKTVNYGADGRVSSFVYDSGAYLNYIYDDENKTVSTESSVETTTSQTYNDALITVSSTDENGNTTEYTYDSHYRTLTETKDGTTVTYTYDSNGNVLSETSSDEDAENAYYTYDSNNNLIRQQTGNKHTYYAYNSNGELTQKINTDTGLKYIYGENGSVSVYKTADNTLVNSYTETQTEADEANNITAKTDIAETHFGQSFTSVVKDKSIDYTFNGNTAWYSYQTEGTDESEKMTADTVKYNGNTALSSAYTYDDKDNITNKLYTFKIDGEDHTVDIQNQYDSEGRITDTGYNGYDIHYTYDSNGQLIRVDNAPASHTATVYSYDSRGNVIEKRVHPFTYTEDITSEPTETKTFTYANSGWKDLLVAVDGVELTYDEIGNVLTFGSRSFTWNSGRNLASITDNGNIYSYKYDENGIRTSKTVNGVTTYYNTKDGVILSQSDGTNTMYFQYDTSGTPLGFVYNGTQYFYLTNQMGDVIAIIDANYTPVCEYIYDEWGNILDIAYVDEENAQQVAVANANPIRYRGYYYDTETGYYYLQSRYYDPSICRFINADSTDNLDSPETVLSYNLFSYCENNPINHMDPYGFLRRFTYFFVYDKSGKDFKEQANWMKDEYFTNKSVRMIYMHDWKNFSSKWNSLVNKKVANIFLFLHGGAGCLYFDNDTVYLKRIKSDLKKIKSINGKIYLLSCKGGTKNQDGFSVAGTIAVLQAGITVRAVVNGSVYYRAWYQLFDRKPLTKEKKAYWADFRYARNKGKQMLMEMYIGKKWYYG